MALLFKDDPTFLADDGRLRMALLLTALELRYRFACTAVWAQANGVEVQVAGLLPEDRFAWETNHARMTYWAHCSVLQSRLMTARYSLPITVGLWANGLWEPVGAARIDAMVSTPSSKPTNASEADVAPAAPIRLREKTTAADVHVSVGCALLMHGKLELAKDALRKALLVDENHTEAWFYLGCAYYSGQDYAQSVVYFRAALNSNPEHALAWQSMGNALCSMQSFGPGMVCYNKALSIDAKAPGLHHNMGNALIGLKKYVEAEARLREAMSIDPMQEKNYNTLGNLYFSRHDYPAAAAHYEACILLRPSYAAGHTNLANALLSMHDGARAIAYYEEGLKLEPKSAGVRYNLALAYLREGKFDLGWRAHEARWEFKELKIPQRKFKQPLWDGKPFEGKTLLVYAEQGLGDTIQFCRYLDYVHALAGNTGQIVFEVQERLKRLMAHNFGCASIRVVERLLQVPDCDLRVPLMTLPLIFGTRLTTIPAPTRYICAVDQPNVIQTKLRVGLCWAGNPKYKADHLRSLPVAVLQGLPKDVHYVCLQHDKPDDVAYLETQLPLEVPPVPNDVADTAYVIEGLDVVLTSDTVVAHLAAAMGKTVWLMVCYLADWRWLNREWNHSPWYPTMRIFRQQDEGNWDRVIQEVGTALGHLSKMHVGSYQ